MAIIAHDKLPTAFAALLACLRYEPEQKAKAPSLTAREWEEVIQQASAARITPLLYDRLRTRQWLALLPAACCTRLARHYQKSATHNLQLLTQALRVLDALQLAGVPAILLKGLHLANFVYPEPAIRTMGDVDLLVPAHLVERAEQTLQALQCELTTAQPHWHKHEHYHLRYRFPRGPGYLELHWHLHRAADAAAIDRDTLWQRARKATLAGVDIYLLSPPDLFVFLCFHVAKHRFAYRGLRSLHDIAELIHAHLADEDWPLVLQAAKAWQVEKQVHLALLLTAELFGVTAPPTVTAALATAPLATAKVTPLLVASVVDLLVTGHQPQLSNQYAQLWQPGQLATKLGLLRRACFLPRAQMAAIYPATPYSLYCFYPVRWFELWRRYHQITWQLLQGQREAVAQIQQLNALHDWLAS